MSAGKTFPLNLFGIAFGLSGLAGTWTVAGERLGIDAAVADAFWILAAVVWAVSVTRYLLGARTVRQIVGDLGHPILGPFAALAAGLIGGQSLSTVGLHSMGLLIGWIAVRSIVFVTVNHRKTALEPVAAG
jgi:tellurite resistance protein